MTNLSSTSENSKAIFPSDFSLGSRELDNVFPFHFFIDSDTRIVHAGPAIHRLLPDLVGREKLDASFIIKHPPNLTGYEEICEHSDQLFLLKSRSLDKLLLKGQILYLPHADVIVFIGEPWLTDSSDIDALGLSLNDFAIHDSVPDYLLLLRTLKTSLRDAQALTEQLNVMNRQLESRIEERTQQVVSANTTLMETNRRLLQEIAERELVENRLRVAAATFETHDAIVITDARANIVRVNQAFQNITGFSSEEVLGKNPRIFSSGLHDKAFYAAMWKQLLDTGSWGGEIWGRCKNGRIYPKWMDITAVKNKHGETTEYVAISSDFTARKQAEDEIRNLAFYDSLTRLPNRRLLLDRLRSALTLSARSNQYGALLFLDMDNFKALNDTLGHDYGDLLLIEVAERIQSCVREVDTVARLGGDEFVVLLEEIDEHSTDASRKAAVIAEKIRASLSSSYHLKDNEHHSSPSIGVCLYHGNEESVDDLLKHADMAMYQAKDSGRNAVRFFDPAMQLALETRAALEVDLRRAVPDGQLQLHYQIQVNNDHQTVGAEALVRWIHPKRGMVYPAQFIPVAEESSLILDIGGWVLDTACRQLGVWSGSERTRDLTLSVNVSAQQFRQCDFVDMVALVMRAYQIDASRLKLELTESMMLHDVNDVIAKMHALKALGVKLSMDDFGTGYSSLSYLKQFPLDQIKIDQSFVRDIATDQNDAMMVKTIIEMAQNFKLNVIAEGVETQAQLDFLKLNGCMAYQGYLFSNPVAIEQFEALLK